MNSASVQAAGWYCFLVSVLTGVAGALLLPLQNAMASGVWLLVIAVAVLLVWRRAKPAATPLLLIALCLAGVAVGVFRVGVTADVAPVPSEDTTFTGTVVRDPEARERTTHLYIQNEHETILVITDAYNSFTYGDTLQVTGDITLPESFESELGRTFHYAGYLKGRGVERVLFFPEQVEVVATGDGNTLIAALLSFKHTFTSALEQAVREPAVALGEGLLLGEKRALGEEWEEAFRRTGLIHIVVLSGYNVMLVVSFFLFVCAFFLPWRARALVGIVGVIAFALLVGLSATVVRASIMAGLVLIATALGRTYAILRALVLAAVVMVLVQPHILLYDPGFQLSFLATLGLVLIAPALEVFLVTAPRRLGMRDFLLATVATQIAVLPLLLYQIGEVSVIAVVANVLVLPLVPVAMLLTALTGGVALVSPAAALPLGFVTEFLLNAILWLTALLSKLPFATVTVPPFSVWFVLAAYAVMGFLWYRWQKGRQTKQTLSKSGSKHAPKIQSSNLDDWEIVEEK